MEISVAFRSAKDAAFAERKATIRHASFNSVAIVPPIGYTFGSGMSHRPVRMGISFTRQSRLRRWSHKHILENDFGG